MPTFNGDTLTITLDSGVTDVDVINGIYEPWKDWMLATPLNRGYPAAFRSDGGNPLSAIINQGSYIFLNNTAGWRIKPPEEDITIYLTGNLAVEDTNLPAFLPTDGAFTAAILGLQPVTQGVTPQMRTQLEQVSFGGRVHLSNTGQALTASGYDANGNILGTHSHPVNNISDAKTLLIQRGFNEIHVLSDFTIGATDNIDGLTLAGTGMGRTELTFTSGCSTSNTALKDCSIKGAADGALTCDRVLIYTITGVGCTTNEMIFNECTFAGNVTLRADNTVGLDIIRSGSVNNNMFVLDINGTAGDITFHSYSDRVQINNMTQPINLHFAGAGAELVLDATCTAGFAEIHGDCVLINNSTIPTVDDDTVNTKMDEAWQLMGLDPANPLVVSATQMLVDAITVNITGTDTKTATRV